jgi:predicted secreted protein
MRWTSIVAIYLLFWVMSAFLVMPFGIRTHEEAGEALVPDRPAAPPPISARAVWPCGRLCCRRCCSACFMPICIMAG